MTGVYIIEGDHGVRDAMSLALDASGFDVSDFPDVQSFVDNAAPDIDDVVIVDLDQSDSSGEDLLNTLCRDPDGPVTIATSGQRKAQVEFAYDRLIGRPPLIRKPFSIPMLQDAFAKIGVVGNDHPGARQTPTRPFTPIDVRRLVHAIA